MKRIIALLLLPAFLVACAGRPANPVMVDQVGDAKKSCTAIQTEMKSIESEIARLLPQTDKKGKNIGLGVAGAFLLVPLFFMDLTESEKIEVESYRQRFNRLKIIAVEKQCPFATNEQEASGKGASSAATSASK